MSITVTIEESDRQAILLAIGHLAVDRPGWNYMLGDIADTLRGRELYEEFKRMKSSTMSTVEQVNAELSIVKRRDREI